MELAGALGRGGHRVHLFARREPLALREFGAGVVFHGLGYPGGTEDGSDLRLSRLDSRWIRRDLQAFEDLIVSVCKVEKLDVLHFHYAVPFAGIVAGVRSRMDGSSPVLVGTLHGTDVTHYGVDADQGPHLREALATLQAVTTVSQSHAALATGTLGLESSPMVIPNFVDMQRFRPASRRRRSRRRPRVIHVSNFRPVKDPAALARVFMRVHREVGAELWLVGDGEEMPTIRSMLRSAGMAGAVRFFGLHRRVERVLPLADVMLMTSRAESFCLVALEAAACGVPVVAPAVGGLPEVVEHLESGLLFEPGDEEAAAEAVVGLVEDPGRRDAMGGRARARASMFALEGMAPRYLRLYRDLLDGASDHRGDEVPKEA